MKRDKPIQTSRISAEKDGGGFLEPGRKLFVVLFLIVLLCTIGLKIYKADRTGIIYDESLTFQRYCDSVRTALTSFDPADASSTNNHLLNSIFIHYARRCFGSYEHFIRIPSLLAGIVFSLTVAFIIYKTIHSGLMRVVSLAMVSLIPFVFDYSYLARGYAFGLAGIYAQIAFVLWLLEHKVKLRYQPIVAVVISAMNFLAFGSMMSSMIVLAGFNATFILLYSPRIFSDVSHKVKPVILNLVSISALTGVSVFLLYRHIYKDILGGRSLVKINKGWRGWPSFIEYLRNLLVGKVFGPTGVLGTIIFWTAVLLIVVGIVIYIYRLSRAIKTRSWSEYVKIDSPASFVIIVTCVTIAILFIYSVILNRSPGLPRRVRSQIFLIPMAVTSGLIILDRLADRMSQKGMRRFVRAVVITIVVLVTVRNLPSPYRMGGSTLSGPVLRKLKAIAPDKTWNIAFSEKMKLFYMGFVYYKQFDYKFNIVRQGNYDVFICRQDEQPAEAVSLNWAPFDDSVSRVIINCRLPADRVVIEARLIKD
ncbi:MAG: hypothetical protein DRP65_05095 [Planctomycetota bacterium]|nr:MAG: hypothetical protein DRP65_05095 [Planctomycetota bacterium]